ncbi:MAG: hypothetical protein JWM56_1329 [Candidatus Peribacteria bacterium]|nr:hypothetical protein [Candidatus Peribacteria bacterium]
MSLKTAAIPGQAKAIYKLLVSGKALSANDLASKLRILPNAVYRNTRKLIELGLIEQLDQYPVQFKMRPIDEAMKEYLSVAQKDFTENFFPRDSKNTIKTNTDISISFIRTRSELLDMTNTDMETVEKSIDHIVSGLELPADTMLAYKKVLDRGIKLRFIVQNFSELNKGILRSWQKMGMEIRFFPLMEARIIIFDSNIVYLTSYDPRKKEQAIGIRFAYTPIVKQMSELFENRWTVSKALMTD